VPSAKRIAWSDGRSWFSFGEVKIRWSYGRLAV
jgi:hypothetical protein